MPEDLWRTLDNAVREIPLGFAVIQRTGAGHVYRVCNEALALLNGGEYTAADHVGTAVEAIYPELWPIIRPHVEAVLDRGETVTFDIPEVHMPGVGLVDFKATYAPVVFAGNRYLLALVERGRLHDPYLDVLEDLRRASEELRSVYRADGGRRGGMVRGDGAPESRAA